MGGNTEAIIHEKNGLLVTPKNTDEIADAIVRLAKDKGWREKLGKESVARVNERFTHKQCIDSYVKLYQSVFLR